MATQTPYFGLTKSGGTEAALIGVYNNNMDIIDLEIWQSMVRAAINLAPIYDETEAYVEGDYCTLLETVQQTVTGFHLYKCTTDTTDPAGTFDPSSWSEVDITSEMGHGGGGGGGHTYIGNDGSTAMTQRDNAQFVGAYMEDDSSNDITKVNVMRSMHRAEFEQLSEAEKQGIIFVDDETTGTDDKFQPVIYSLEEREIGVWIDGKPLYEKTIDFGALPNSTTKNVAHNVANLDEIVKLSGAMYNSNEFYDLPFLSLASLTGCAQLFADSQNVSISTGVNRSEYNGVVFIQYTKTTDQAGSGQWTPQGVPAVHYEEGEQIIGTWINGETLYRKVIKFSSSIHINGNSWDITHFDLTDLGLDDPLIDIVISTKISTNGVGNDSAFLVAYAGADYSTNKLNVLNTLGNGIDVGTMIIEYTRLAQSS